MTSNLRLSDSVNQKVDKGADVGRRMLVAAVDGMEVFDILRIEVLKHRHQLSGCESPKKLKTDYVDLLLLHWPNTTVPLGAGLGRSRLVAGSGKGLLHAAPN